MKTLWRTHMPALLKHLSRYGWLNQISEMHMREDYLWV